jgi:hypothetical protein
LHGACTVLGLDASGATVPTLLDRALVAWRQRWVAVADSAIVARPDQPFAASPGDTA